MGFASFLCRLEAQTYTAHRIHSFHRVVDDPDYRIKVFQWGSQPWLKSNKTKDVWNEIISHRPDEVPKQELAASFSPLQSPRVLPPHPTGAVTQSYKAELCGDGFLIPDHAAAPDSARPSHTPHWSHHFFSKGHFGETGRQGETSVKCAPDWVLGSPTHISLGAETRFTTRGPDGNHSRGKEQVDFRALSHHPIQFFIFLTSGLRK